MDQPCSQGCMEATRSILGCFGVILGQWKRKWKLIYRILGLYLENGKENGHYYGILGSY